MSEEYEECGAYYRKSVVKDGDKEVESIDVQRMKCTDYGASREPIPWKIVTEYIDEGISASKGLYRPDFMRMMQDIEAGTLKRLVVREQARLSREDFELHVFLRAVKKHEVEVRDASGREIKGDLLTKIKAAVDTDYADQVKKNSTEHQEYIAVTGKPPGTGHRPYGYTKNYANVIEAEAEVIRECVKRVTAGEKLYNIVKDLNKREIYKYSGKPWKSQDLSKVLNRSANAAIRTYKGEESKGQWPKIIEPEEYRDVKAILDKNEPYSETTARKHLLVGILVCGVCGVKLSAKNPSYWCNPNRGGCGKIVRNMKALDDYMIRRTYEHIKKLPKPSDEPKQDDTETKIEKLEKEREELRETRSEVGMSFKDFHYFATEIDNKIKALRKQQVKTMPLPVDDAQSFLKAGTDKKRDTIRRLYPVVGVLPTGKRGRRFNPDQLEF
ncbi:recombinase family protein [Amycolatopsis sp. lyj-112]|uniref:recombinase family protein n=1 Tax=Amycolatopsis sp. lyj-112 TaxID=2789288 RepID=UPI0039796B96